MFQQGGGYLGVDLDDLIGRLKKTRQISTKEGFQQGTGSR